MRHLVIACALVVLASCNAATRIGAYDVPACFSDSDCEGSNLCFPDGCGDPGRNIVVEVTANTRSGLHAQDIAIEDGKVTSQLDLTVNGPISITGEVQRIDGDINAELYRDVVTVRATGTSLLIPGVVRSYQLTANRLEAGAYELLVGAGKYRVSALAADRSIPPAATAADVLVTPDHKQFVRLDFPAAGSLFSLSGRLIKRRIAGSPAVEMPLTQVAVDLQAFDPITGNELSQRTNVSSGTPSSKGDFVLSLPPSAAELDAIELVATPRELGSLVPTKRFTLTRPFSSTMTLEMGEFGDTLPQLEGVVLDDQQQPLGNATVALEGTVGGGGTFRSAVVKTDVTGTFRVDLLVSPENANYVVTVFPPPTSSAGILQAAVHAEAVTGQTPLLTVPGQPGVKARLMCPPKMTVTGTLLQPDGMPAASVPLVATPLSTMEVSPMPLDVTTAVTDTEGRYQLRLDPAKYRLDFEPGENMPRRSRVVEVRGNIVRGGEPVEVGPLSLTVGRTISGSVSLTTAGSPTVAPRVAPNAILRFFRTSPIQGESSALPLGETVADERGKYSIVLPGSPR